tara:strand:+ start:409 stop:1428 length:1020 start_codon:yes stop_codon:yes gene_type:complete
MARFGNLRLLPENETQRALDPTQFIVHTAVDHPGPTDLYNYFGRTDVTVESHWWLTMDGRLEQFIETNVQAHANLHGNSRALSIETEDEGDPAHTPWTEAQIDTLVGLLVWVHQEHGIPLEIMDRWDRPGLGWHSMWGFVDGENLTGGYYINPWTNSRGKTCPGKLRIRQFIDIVIPRAQALAGTFTESESRMELSDWHVLVTNATGQQYSPAVELWQNLLNIQGADLVLDGYVGWRTEAAHLAYTEANSGKTTKRPTGAQWVTLLHALRRANLVPVVQPSLALTARLEEEIAIGDQLALDLVKAEQALANAKSVSNNRLTIIGNLRAKVRKVRRTVKL